MTIPLGWRLEKLGDCCQIISEATPNRNNPEYWGGNIPWVTPKDLSKLETTTIDSVPEKITSAGYKSCSTTLIPKGSILFSSRATIGLVAVTGCPMCTNQGFKSIVPGPLVDSRYLYWCMKISAPKIEALGNGTTFKEVSKKIVENFEIPLPPLAEQVRIAAILDQADSIRRKRIEAIKLTEELLKSTFLEMFGDPVINPKGWKVKKLEDVALPHKGAIKCGPFGSQLLISEFVTNGIPVYGIDNVQKNKFIWAKPKYITPEKYEQLKSFTISSGDVLISRTGTVGRTCIAPKNVPLSIIGPNLLKVSLNEQFITAEYLSHALSYSVPLIEQIEAMSPGSTVAVFNTTNLKALTLAIPPLNLQCKFTKINQAIQVQKEKLENNFEQLDYLFNSLLQRAFRGEL